MAAQPRTHLRTRILGYSFVPTAIILLTIAFLIYYAYQRVTEELVTGKNEQLIHLSAGQLATDLNSYVNTLAALSHNAGIYGGDPVQQSSTLKLAANGLLVFDGGVLILDLNGKVIAIQPGQTDLIGQDWSKRAFFRQIIRNGMPVFSDIILGSQANPEVIAIAVPILNEVNEFRGILVGMFRLGASSYSAFYGGIVKLRLEENGSTYLVDGNGRVIYHPDSKTIGADLHLFPAVQRVLTRQVGYLKTEDLSHQPILASFAPVPGTSWGLINEENWNSLLAASRGYGQFLFLLLGMGIILPTLVVMIGVRRITEPIAKLIDAAREISGGKYGQQISVHTGDELEDLITQFNSMSTKLQESYAQLEQRVAARTKELAALNAIAAVASRSLNLEEILNGALEQTLQALGMEWGTAYQQIEDGSHLNYIAQRGLSEEFIHQVSSLPVKNKMFEIASPPNKMLIWQTDEYPDASLQEWLEKEGILQVMWIPLIVKDQTVGAFFAGSRQIHSISPEEAALLSAIGQQVGVAVENARLFDEAERSATLAERTRLARELHDSVTQSLYSVTLFAEAAASLIASGDISTANRHLHELRDTAQEALREMRLLIFEMRPLPLEQNGLTQMLQERLEAVEARGGMKSELRVEGENHLLLNIQEELYHIAQEALNNVIKHAHARRVDVSLYFSENFTRLEVCDDGAGFDPNQLHRGGMGLGTMHERAQRIGGNLQIESMPGKGTKISVQVPAGYREEKETVQSKDQGAT